MPYIFHSLVGIITTAQRLESVAVGSTRRDERLRDMKGFTAVLFVPPTLSMGMFVGDSVVERCT